MFEIVDVASRFLEHFILNGPDPNVLDSVINQLNDPKRKQPQELDKAVVGMWGVQSFCFSASKSQNLVMDWKL